PAPRMKFDAGTMGTFSGAPGSDSRPAETSHVSSLIPDGCLSILRSPHGWPDPGASARSGSRSRISYRPPTPQVDASAVPVRQRECRRQRGGAAVRDPGGSALPLGLISARRTPAARLQPVNDEPRSVRFPRRHDPPIPHDADEHTLLDGVAVLVESDRARHAFEGGRVLADGGDVVAYGLPVRADLLDGLGQEHDGVVGVGGPVARELAEPGPIALDELAGRSRRPVDKEARADDDALRHVSRLGDPDEPVGPHHGALETEAPRGTEDV